MAESSAAASTSMAAQSDYDVFINHRGPDVKKTLASHLYWRLLSCRLRVFLDQPELQRGEYLTPQFEDAIRSASVHVAIFSPGYADSIWCLNELLQMLDSKAPIIPVFYHVSPTELRWTHGKGTRYAEALENLESKTEYDPQTQEQKLRYDSSKIENWRKALSKVAGISGFELEACNGDEGELVDKVVEVVLKKVKRPALYVAEYPVGLDDQISDLENTVLLPLQRSRKPQILGIVGLGGIGKTTLAKEFFNRKNSDYSTSCFLSDVRDNAGKGLILLQKKILKSLNVPDMKIDRIDGVDEGKEMLRTHLSSAKTLVILDDVDGVDQVEALLPFGTVLHSDCLILITSRNKDVLISSKVEKSSIYKLKGLATQHSRELFCSRAFNQPDPLPLFESLVEEFLKACNGLPLSLKVFGALLYGKEVCDGEDELRRLQQILPAEIQQRLKRSYDSLSREEQYIFLDIACFFRGQNKDRAIRIWDGSRWQGRRGFQNLRNRCLVEVDSKNDIQMHDHLRDLGRDIAEDPGLPWRLWRWTEKTINDLLERPTGRAVRGVRMAVSESNDIDALGVIGMKRLQLLDTEDVLVERILTKVESPNLIWLRWNNCPCSSLPCSISLKNLRVLQVQGSKLETLWENESQAPLQLRELEIKAPLSSIPESIGQLKHLEQIVIGNDPFHGNAKLQEEFRRLQSSKDLALKRCSTMNLLLANRLGNLANVQQNQLENCQGILANLQQMQSHCQVLERMLESFDNLANSFDKLANLQRCQLKSCPVLERLPESFGNLANLQYIDLSFCTALESLPDYFGNLTNLHHINLSYCTDLERLPDSFCKLIKLQYLDLHHCIELALSRETLGNISTLEYINLSYCEKIEVLPPQVAHQRSLERLHLVGTKVKELPSTVGELSDLEVLMVGGPCLDTLPSSLRGLKNLKKLRIN